QLFDGPLPPKELQAGANQAGILPRTLRRAKEELQVVSRRSGPGGSWECSLPAPSWTRGTIETLVAGVQLWLKTECTVGDSDLPPVVARDCVDEHALLVWGGDRPLRLLYDAGAAEWVLQEVHQAAAERNGKPNKAAANE